MAILRLTRLSGLKQVGFVMTYCCWLGVLLTWLVFQSHEAADLEAIVEEAVTSADDGL